MTRKVLTTLFADVCGSTGIYEKLGDQEGRDLVYQCVRKMQEISEVHGGRFIKSNGDDIMCTFETPSQAATAAAAMQVYMEEFANTQTEVSVAVRIGFQHGIVVEETSGDVRGDSVNVAARLADYAKASQIVTSEATLAELNSDNSARHLETVRLKGKTEPVGICEMLWKNDYTMTVFASDFTESDSANLRLAISMGEQTCSVSAANFKVCLGRDASSDILVCGKRASRQHATIEFRRGSFVLTDVSTNATYLKQGMDETRLHREQTPLVGSGQISLGVPFSKDPQEVIEFSPEPAT